MHTRKPILAISLLIFSTAIHPGGSQSKPSEPIVPITTIRNTQLSDFDLLTELAVGRESATTFDYVPISVEREINNSLNGLYGNFTAQEKTYFQTSKPDDNVSIVAETTDTQGEKAVVAFYSAQPTNTKNQLFIRWLVNKGLMKDFVKTTMEQKPDTESIVCCTKVTNKPAQEQFEALGAQKVVNPLWTNFLYQGLNPEDYFGYFFNNDVINRFINS